MPIGMLEASEVPTNKIIAIRVVDEGIQMMASFHLRGRFLNH